MWLCVDISGGLTEPYQRNTEFFNPGRYPRPVSPVRPVVLSGGSGTRLWPLSTPDVPKQFRALTSDRSLFSLTLERLRGVPGLAPAIVVTGERHLALVEAEVETAPIEVGTIVVEPAGRNTAPAALAAALVADPDDVLVILPSDHLIRDVDGFLQAMNVALELADDGGIVIFGIEPTRPETGFGYIEVGSEGGSAHRVASFKEKPGPEEALELIRDGLHLWNSGIFVGRADQILAEAREWCPRILDAVRAAVPPATGGEVRLTDTFESVEAISFDYAIMEKTEHARVVPLDVGWSDIGSYRSLLEVSDLDASGNHISGNVTHAGVTNSYVSASSRPVVIAGLDRIVVVETADAVLVVSVDRAQDVKELQERIDGE